MPFLRCFALVFCLLSTSALAESPRPHVVMLIAEGEYQTHETLPAFAKQFLQKGYRTTFVFADPDDPNRLVGIQAVKSADVLIVSVRRRTLTKQQLDVVRAYVASGKPVIGIRTASHAFCLRKAEPPEGRAVWRGRTSEPMAASRFTRHWGMSMISVAKCCPCCWSTRSLGVLRGRIDEHRI